ncbi:unnamed protein product [Blepharisma stoltei]|uniref:Uncharacterized protein n=1 Tax=Blepharisma stoltei TaxID=1481888 RepID=A0AAU9JF24_9CILI|nr:unnamed protein product [Blepharisma stoltei]
MVTSANLSSYFFYFSYVEQNQKQTCLRAAKDEELQVLGFGREGFCYGYTALINVLPKIEDSECIGKTLKFCLSKFIQKKDEELKRTLYSSFAVELEAFTRDEDVIRSLRLPSGDAMVTFADETAWNDWKKQRKTNDEARGKEAHCTNWTSLWRRTGKLP